MKSYSFKSLTEEKLKKTDKTIYSLNKAIDALCNLDTDGSFENEIDYLSDLLERLETSSEEIGDQISLEIALNSRS